ncbi:MAG: FAD-dependent pyridine nucleotide-disulfide oxidoreductase [Gaiellaceae bacterium]|nr:FAD-dependent pyridine nucleotide-disulfide oxidoreductase [Gaiellaceae bacterium]MDF2751857.1 FAD-dependent pyridine nucleotide-disulfide oxidoreductase [Gaiellaceae bacterium]
MSAPLRAAVVGSGPAAFYAAAALLASEDPKVEVDMVERLPTPWGLVRLGVAPDHPQLKTVSRAFEKIAARPGFRFLGNVEIGRDVTHEELAALYDAVVYAVGSQADRRLGIPGEDLPGSWAATELVAWYNGHPDHQHLDFDLSHERAVVVGNGNVALDVARMLALTREELAPTDTTDAAIEAIVSSRIREIVVLGRRGPVQAAWTATELAELGNLGGADVVVDPAELELDPASAAELEAAPNVVQRNVEILRDFATREPSGKPRTVRLRFRSSPVAILGRERVEGIEIARNELEPDERGSVRAVATDEREAVSCGLVFRSVGYRGIAIPGVPFDEQSGTIPNSDGRVLDERGAPIPGLYCAGWIKRGPTGVIGTNKKDATETVERVLEDARDGRLRARAGGTIEEALADREAVLVMYAGWEAIDALERSRGEPHGRPRVKLCTWDELLATASISSAN